MKLFHRSLAIALAAASPLSIVLASSETNQPSIEEVVVTADFRDSLLQEMPISATIISEDAIKERNAQHLEQLLALAPNINFSSGSSRARYIQIRGIGERSQFKEPINPSVGLIIDGVDFTGIGTAGTLFDMQQVEILRGPQGTRYGANALAGIIAMQSQQPTAEVQGHIDTGIANNNTWNIGAAAGGSISENVLYRAALQKNSSDGHIKNDYLNRKDTNNLDEVTARTKLRWLASDDLTIDTNFMFIDIDNGYDAFSFDSSRNTISDQPGHDKQKTTAIFISADWKISPELSSQIIGSFSDSNLEYGFDEDWSNPGLCAGINCDYDNDTLNDDYSSFDNYKRERKNSTFEARLLSGENGRIFNDSSDWLIGVYLKNQREGLQRQYTYLPADFFSQFDTQNTAAFAEISTALTEKLTLTVGSRVELWEANYKDSNALKINTDETLYGGKLALDYQYNNGMVYFSLAKGYKAGGVNTDGSLNPNSRAFENEHQLAYELGIKNSLFDNKLQTRTAIFYTQRKDQQVKGSILVTRPDFSTEFIDYIDNAAQGTNYGVEFEAVLHATEKLTISSSIGWLSTEFDQYINDNSEDLSGREQAHAPTYQYSLEARYNLTPHWHITAGAEGKDQFYFSDRHNAQSNNVDLLNAQISYNHQNWSISFWGKNLGDKDYAVRGFGSFGNDPRNFYTTETYTQLGAPRTYGINTSYSF
jgi:outer membrane receptor protein involved in Fe transport